MNHLGSPDTASSSSEQDPSAQPTLNIKTTEQAQQPRPCLACGYDLQGLGEEPRCPECGLLNIPEGYRRQVWELVDSGKWFFSSFFGVFRKRPPGWWWSLDRAGDVKRALRFAVACIATSLATILLTGALAGSVVHTTYETYVWTRPAAEDPSLIVVSVTEGESTLRLASIPFDYKSSNIRRLLPKDQIPQSTKSTKTSIQFSWYFLEPCFVLLGLIFATWAFPACVGIWTQIRKSLPSFARAPRTILAASLYETHRMIYSSGLLAFFLLLDATLRSQGYSPSLFGVTIVMESIPLLVFAFAAGAWIGPLRSDYTRQLVRSRRHALRIVIMYALLFPAVTVFAVVAFIASLEILAG